MTCALFRNLKQRTIKIELIFKNLKQNMYKKSYITVDKFITTRVCNALSGHLNIWQRKLSYV